MQDAADRHVARWQDHWLLDHPFDPVTEAVSVRLGSLTRYLRSETARAARAAGLEPFEYATLHQLFVSDTPGRATPGALAAATDVTPAGMTGRLDALERAGLVRRTPDPEDRRRTVVEATDAALARWRETIRERGRTEEALLAPLAPAERVQLADLLRRLTLAVEGGQ